MLNSNLEREVIGDDIYVDKKTGDIITPLDLSGLSGTFSDAEIQSITNMYASLPENESEALLLINEIFQEAISFLQEELLYEDKEFGNVLKLNFRSLQDFYDFIRATKNKKGRIKCSILKHMLCIYDSYGKYNPRIQEITDKTSRVVDTKLKNGSIQVIEESEDGDFLRGVVVLNNKPVFFNMIRRLKSERSRVMKEMNDPKYHSIERLGDNYGVTFELDDPTNIPIFTNYVADASFKKKVYDIKLRTSITKEEIYTHPGLSDEFRKKWLEAENMKKPETPDDLDDVRVVTPMYKDDEINNMSVEYRIVARKNKNENGLTMHDVMGYFKKIKNRIRSETYINPEYIERISRALIGDLESLLEKNKLRMDNDVNVYKFELFRDLKEHGFIPSSHRLNLKDTKEKMDELLVSGIIGYYKSLLTPVKINGVGKTRYTLKRNLKLSQEFDIFFDSLSPMNA